MQAYTEHTLFTYSQHVYHYTAQCTGIHITENLLMRYECRRAILLIAYHRNWFPFPDPLERRFYSKDGHQWNNSETWICNIMNIFMTLDQTANKKNIKMVLCKFIQSRRAEMPRDTGSWITMNHMHTACIAHTVYSWPHGRSLCTCQFLFMGVSRYIFRFSFYYWPSCPFPKTLFGLGALQNVASFKAKVALP